MPESPDVFESPLSPLVTSIPVTDPGVFIVVDPHASSIVILVLPLLMALLAFKVKLVLHEPVPPEVTTLAVVVGVSTTPYQALLKY
jgi:hypothetical protein